MTIEIRRRKGEVTVEIEGRLDTTTAPALQKTIVDDIGDAKELSIDLKGVEYISSAGLRVLLAAQKNLHGKGTVRIKNVSEAVMEVFTMTGFAEIFTIE